ncbi:MAG: DUF882 domain-containing protein [Pseudomonadota bacterium]
MGRLIPSSSLRQEPWARASGRLHVQAAFGGESATVEIFKPDGSLDESALAKLDRLFRCRRTQEVRAIDPRLYEVLAQIHDHFEGKTIHLISGFRYQRNEGSRHFHGAAVDLRVAGVSYQELYQFAETLDRGGMGIGKYPRDNFVHIDFRAPGEPSYRWTDTTRGKGRRGRGGRLPSLMWRSGRPNS